MNIAVQIRAIREHFFGGSNKDFAEFMGENTNATSNWVNGNNIGINIVEKIITKFPDVAPGWLLTGEGSMLKSETNNNTNVSGSGNIVASGNGVAAKVFKGNVDNTRYKKETHNHGATIEDVMQLLEDRFQYVIQGEAEIRRIFDENRDLTQEVCRQNEQIRRYDDAYIRQADTIAKLNEHNAVLTNRIAELTDKLLEKKP